MWNEAFFASWQHRAIIDKLVTSLKFILIPHSQYCQALTLSDFSFPKLKQKSKDHYFLPDAKVEVKWHRRVKGKLQIFSCVNENVDYICGKIYIVNGYYIENKVLMFKINNFFHFDTTSFCWKIYFFIIGDFQLTLK